MAEELGPIKPVVSSIYEIADPVLEQIRQWLEGRGLRTPISDVVGYQQLTPTANVVSGAGSSLGTTTSASFADMPSGAAQMDNVRAGTYLFFYSARVTVDAAANTGVIGLRLGSTDPGGASSATANHFLFNNTQPTTQSQMFATTLSGDTTSVKLRWLVTGGTATVYEYTLFRLKIGV